MHEERNEGFVSAAHLYLFCTDLIHRRFKEKSQHCMEFLRLFALHRNGCCELYYFPIYWSINIPFNCGGINSDPLSHTQKDSLYCEHRHKGENGRFRTLSLGSIEAQAKEINAWLLKLEQKGF